VLVSVYGLTHHPGTCAVPGSVLGSENITEERPQHGPTPMEAMVSQRRGPLGGQL
jgi:hypothetical protein